MEQMENVLRLYVLKEEQCHAVLGLLEQKDFVPVLPTGFGKTLIIFLFAAVKSNEEKSTWNCSASALRGIINDQVEAMREAGISAIASPCFGTMRLCGHSVFLKTESYNHRVRFLKSWLYSLSKKGVSVALRERDDCPVL